jgi:hypothetical protein
MGIDLGNDESSAEITVENGEVKEVKEVKQIKPEKF